MPNNSGKYTDLLTAFPFGVSSGVAPLLLPKEQAAWGINCTFRGGYAKTRPPIQKLTLNFNGDDELQNAVRKGFYQGCDVYRPDFGNSQIIAQIGGRLFRFQENGVMWDVDEITIPGDPNDATTNQVWMWQAEKWLIISDGTSKLPIFYDGVSCRRSNGPSVVLAEVTAVDLPGPNDIGTIVTATLSAAYSGPFNVPVIFNDAFYEIQSSASPTPGTYLATLTNNLKDSGSLPATVVTPGNSVAAGSQVVVRPSDLDYIITGFPSQGLIACSFGDVYFIEAFSARFDGPSANMAASAACVENTNSQILVGGTLWQVYQKLTTTFKMQVIPYSNTPHTIGLGDLVQKPVSTSPNVIIGNLSAAFVQPAPGGTVEIEMDAPYTGPDGADVWIGGNLYKISAPSVAPPSTTVRLLNLSDSAAIGGLPKDITSMPEIPACRMGVYGLGQNWFSAVDGLSFGCSDIRGGSSGTPAYNYRDAVLKTSDLSVMGYFNLSVAGEIITSMTFVATLDQALGQGPLQVGVASGMFSCRAPFTLIDFQGTTLTDAITNPILTKSLIGFGPIAQNSTVLANSDTIFRSYEGINSLILARRDFSDLGGNTPISREVTRALENDTQSLLSYGSAIVFDNRLRMTCAPTVSGQGVYHRGEVVLNYDLLSSLRGKAQPVWEGLWTGANILQYTQGLFGPVSRAFAFTFNLTETQIELYELLPTGSPPFDNGDVRIKSVIETPVLFNQNVKSLTDLARLMDGEMYLTDVNGRVDVTVLYRPLFYPCWRPWHSFSICADMSAENAQEQVRVRLGLGEPNPKDCDTINNRPFRDGEGFQVRLELTGAWTLWGLKVLGDPQPTPAFAKPICTPLCLDVPDPEPDV